jgi:hypothetical protein
MMRGEKKIRGCRPLSGVDSAPGAALRRCWPRTGACGMRSTCRHLPRCIARPKQVCRICPQIIATICSSSSCCASVASKHQYKSSSNPLLGAANAKVARLDGMCARLLMIYINFIKRKSNEIKMMFPCALREKLQRA